MEQLILISKIVISLIVLGIIIVVAVLINRSLQTDDTGYKNALRMLYIAYVCVGIFCVAYFLG